MTTVGVLMAGLDTSILIVGLPRVAASLHADAEQAVWFTQSYSLSGTIMLLLMGRITDMFGRLKMYKAGFIIFTVGSLLTSLSQNPAEMIVFRLVQGIGNASLWTNATAMITDSTPSKELGFSLGINQVAGRVGMVLGLTVSGVILLFFDWRFLFYINIPIGIFGIVWAHLRLKDVSTREKGSTVDWFGFATFSIFLTAILFALTFAAYGFAETKSIVVGLLLAGLASFLLFVIQERRTKYPLIDLKVLRIREFSASIFSALLNVISTSSLLLLFSLYLQLVAGQSPFLAGLSLLPAQFAMIASSPLSGRLSDRFGRMPFMLGGLVMTTAAMFLFTQVNQVTLYFFVALFLGLFGAGISIFLAPNAGWGMGVVPANRRGIASSLRNLSFNIGNAVGLSLAVWLITLTVPYDVVSNVVSSGNASLIPVAYKVAFFSGIRTAYIWLGVVNIIAIIAVLAGARLREQRVNETAVEVSGGPAGI